ncbi:MAG: glycosyltransferase family 4 protein [Anaerolineae bacterium]|nr:glycosyltransferase family 4 protein [Anaerolineae bacterium]
MGLRLALFFTENVSLESWQADGLLERDRLLYDKLSALGHEITFVTYGAPDDGRFLPLDSRIRVLARPEGVTRAEYGKRIWQIHGAALRGMDLFKAHQVTGARYAAYASLRLGKPLIARCGYLPSVFQAHAGAPARQRRPYRAGRIPEFSSGAGGLCAQRGRDQLPAPTLSGATPQSLRLPQLDRY